MGNRMSDTLLGLFLWAFMLVVAGCIGIAFLEDFSASPVATLLVVIIVLLWAIYDKMEKRS
jgi:hypothetical protein